jgi:hypothetical protein
VDSWLANFAIVVVDIALFLYAFALGWGVAKKRIYGLGKWYSASADASGYWQVVIGYVLLIGVVAFVRFIVFPERLYQYL